MTSLRILTVDDQEAIRRSIRDLLSTRSDWLICGEAGDGVQAVESARTLRPDVVVMDVSMPHMNGLEATRAIRRELPGTKIIIVSQNDPRVVRQQAAAIRAHAYVAKADLSQELVPTIEMVLDSNADAERSSPDNDSALGSPAASSNDAMRMAGLIACKNWAETPIGAAESWSPTLRTIVNFLLASRFPLLLWWGPEYTQIYNDAYAPILGVKHPHKALGQPVSKCWNEIWHVLQPLIDTPFHGGPATWMEDIELEINRSGRIEESHFTVAYSPVPDETAPSGIGGVLATVHEITEKIVGERRVAILRDLGAVAGEAKTAEEACSTAADVLSKYPKDFPLALLYLNDVDGQHTRLVGCSHVAQGEPGAPSVIELHRDLAADATWPLSQVMRTLGTVIATELTDRFQGNVPRGVWSESPSQAAVVPVRSSHASHLAGFLVAGISAGLRCDEAYLSFLDLAARQIATSIANARAYEEERTRAEALAAIDRAKTAFFSNVSHEFRTPLTLMLAPLHDLLARSQTHLSPTAKDQLELVNRNAARLLRLVNTLLDFSRIEAGRVQAVYEATNLAAFTSELASVFRSATDRAGLRLLVDCRELGEPVYVDRDMWEKIVLNLLSNAFKFTFEGEIAVSVDRGADAAELRVRDTGVGIAPEAISKVFERFHRVANMRSRTHEGSGIGLALVHELVKLHGGSIQVDSTVGIGTTFIVRVPFGQNHLTAGKVGGSRSLSSTAVGATPFVEEALRWLPDVPRASGELFKSEELLPVPCPPTSSAARPRILIADDNADMRQYLARLLAEHYEVETASDGQAAIDAARQRSPNLILSDVMMPVLDGFDLLKAIRTDETTRSIPVVLLSARAGEESRVEGMEAGADDYLVKPFSARELLARISARLEIARLQRDNEQRVTADLVAMTRLREIGNCCVRAGNDVDKCLDEIVAAAIDLTGADKGHLQLLDPQSRILTIRAQRGFQEPFLTFFAAVRDDICACGTAMELRKRVIVEDVSESDIFRGLPSLEILLQAGVRAVQSTPFVSSTGDIVGMISTHFSRPHRLSERESRLMDLLARQAADYLERRRAEEALRELADTLEMQVRARTRELEQRTAELMKQSEDTRNLSARMLNIQDEERRHIARELHDSAGQSLCVLSMNLAQVVNRAKSIAPPIAESLEKTCELTQQLQRDIRTASYLLHPPLLDESGLSSALRWYVEGLVERSGIAIDLSIADGFARLPADMELMIFRLVQECLTNIHRHSGSKTATIRVSREEERVCVEVRDQGKGIQSDRLAEIQTHGFGVGIRGMRERLRQFRGEMKIESSGAGTSVFVNVPVTKLAGSTDIKSLDAAV